MGLKGELGGGFPQPKPALIITFDWDAAHKLGPTTHPKNNLSYSKFSGTVKSVPESGLPPFTADFVDAGAWLQEEVLPSGKIWIKVDAFVLLRVVEPPNTTADPNVAETETGLIRVKWHAVGSLPEALDPLLEKDNAGLIGVVKKEDEPGHAGVMTCSFETGDPRYKYLEHAVYVGKYRMVDVPAEEGRKVVYQVKVSYLAA